MKTHLLIFLKITLCTLALLAWQGVYAAQTTPTSDFIDNGDGTVTHKTTGLIWQRCAVGQTWTGSDCSGEAKTFTYYEAMALKSNFAGHRNWRMPNIDELKTLVSRKAITPNSININTTIFPNTPRKSFWSSSTPNYNINNAFTIDFSLFANPFAISLENPSNVVRLVRYFTTIEPYEKISLAITASQREAHAKISISLAKFNNIDLLTYIDASGENAIAYMPPLPFKYANKSVKFCVLSDRGKKCSTKRLTYTIPSTINQPGQMLHILAGVSQKLGIQFVEPSNENMSKEDLILADLGARALLESLLGHTINLDAKKGTRAKTFDSDSDFIDSFATDIKNGLHDAATTVRDKSQKLINSAGIIGAGVVLVGLAVEAPALITVGGTLAIAKLVGLGFGAVQGAVLDMAPGIGGLDEPSINELKPTFNFFFNNVVAEAVATVTNPIMDYKFNMPEGITDLFNTTFGISNKITEQLNPINDNGFVGRLKRFVGDLQNGNMDIDGYDNGSSGSAVCLQWETVIKSCEVQGDTGCGQSTQVCVRTGYR